MRRCIVGVIGSGNANKVNEEYAFELGRLIAKNGWIVLSGGRNVGVMDAVNRGAKTIKSSITIGVLPTVRSSVSGYIDIAIFTDMNNARNNINVLSSDVVVACGVEGAGTVSEIALALKAGKSVIILGGTKTANAFLKELGEDQVTFAETPKQAISIIKKSSLC